jgi:vacuolar-type H+-ATPase subunit H
VSEAPVASAGGAGLEPIQRVRAAEKQWEAKIASFEARSKTENERLKAEVEAAVAQARADAEKGRASVLERTRKESDALAETLIAEGKAKADAIAGKSAAELNALRTKLVAAVLGGFRPDSG